MDLTTVLSAMGGVGTLTVLQQTVAWWRDERRKTRAARAAEAEAPASHESLMLGIADQATLIQQRSIKSLQDQLDQVQLEVGTLRTENTTLRDQMTIKDAQIKRLYQRIGELEVEIHSSDGREGSSPPESGP